MRRRSSRPWCVGLVVNAGASLGAYRIGFRSRNDVSRSGEKFSCLYRNLSRDRFRIQRIVLRYRLGLSLSSSEGEKRRLLTTSSSLGGEKAGRTIRSSESAKSISESHGRWVSTGRALRLDWSEKPTRYRNFLPLLLLLSILCRRDPPLLDQFLLHRRDLSSIQGI